MIRAFAQESLSAFQDFISREASGGYVLMACAALGLIAANTMFAPIYFQILSLKFSVNFGLLHIEASVLHWINDGLMAIFFLLVGLEIKREVLEGHLSSIAETILPFAAALGGVLVPAAIYLVLNSDDPRASAGWAIPSATDIAFALGILALLGPRVPTSLKILLTAIAIIDDLIAILIIAVFYTDQLSTQPLIGAGMLLLVLLALNFLRITNLWPYMILGGLLWAFVHESGVHATLAGVALSLLIPTESRNDESQRPSALHRLEEALHVPVAFLIVPLFGFANAGVSMLGFTFSDMLEPVPLGVALGLFLGKQLGIFSIAWVLLRLGWVQMPRGASIIQLYGVCVLCGVGFTMSLFIGGLAFEAPDLIDRTKLGVFAGSLLSTTWALAVLISAAPPRAEAL